MTSISRQVVKMVNNIITRAVLRHLIMNRWRNDGERDHSAWDCSCIWSDINHFAYEDVDYLDIRRELTTLVANGLLDQTEETYHPTDKGHQWLEGDIHIPMMQITTKGVAYLPKLLKPVKKIDD